MANQKINNIYKAMVSQLDYIQFIEGIEKNNIDFSKCDIKLLQVIYAGYLFSDFFDNNFIVKDKNIIPLVMQEYADKLAEIITYKIDDYYYFGTSPENLRSKNANEILKNSRNALSHGDYIIEDNKIIFEVGGQKGIVEISKFLKLIASIRMTGDRYNKYYKNTKILNFIDTSNNIRKIQKEKDIDKLSQNLYRIEIIDYPNIIESRTASYKDCYTEFIEFITQIIKNCIKSKNPNSIKNITSIIEEHIKLLKLNGINIEYKITKLTDLPYYQNIKKKFIKNFDEFNNYPLPDQCDLLNNYSYQFGHGNIQKFNIHQGMFLNLELLRIIDVYNNDTSKKITPNKNVSKLFKYHDEDIIVSNYLASFCSLYEYGLESHLSISNREIKLEEIYDKKVLDFTEFDLSLLDDAGMQIRKTLDISTSDPDNKDITILENKKDSQEHILENYTKKCKNPTKQKEQELSKTLEEIKMRLKELKEKDKKRRAEIKVFKDEFDKTKYERNLNIIYHIRNAIAHGNVFIKPCNSTLDDLILILKDYDEDNKLVYYKEVTIADFKQLFQKSNIEYLYSFITSKLEDDSLERKDYIEKIDDELYRKRINKKTIKFY